MSDTGREALRRVPLFREFSDDECMAMLSVLRVRQFASGDEVFRQGNDGDTMVVVADGRLRVEITDAQGHRNEVGAIAQGEIVGEMAVLDPAPRTASVIAASDAVVYELSRANLELLRTTAPSASATIVSAIIGDVTRRLRHVNQRIDRELNPHAAAKVQAPAVEKEAPAPSVFSRIWAKLTGD